MKTAGTLFTGGGGADIGIMEAGYEMLFGLEYVPEIAEVAKRNLGDYVRIADVLTEDPRNYPRVDLLHVSPPCPNFSIAKKGAKETENDLALARKIAEFIRVLDPKYFTLENVRKYGKSESLKIICNALGEMNYLYDVQFVNAADFGVPQTRIRLILRAAKGFLPYLPAKESWVGWYQAIEDLIPALPESKFADWQLKRLPEELKESLSYFRDTDRGAIVKGKEEPAPTIRASEQRPCHWRGFVINTNKTGKDDIMVVDSERPSPTTLPNHNGRARAFILSNQHNKPNGDGEPQSAKDDEPVNTITGSIGGRIRAFVPKAVLIGGGNRSNSFLEFAKENRPDTPGKRFDDEPSHAVSATASQDTRAFVFPGGNKWTPPATEGSPIYTITDSIANHPNRAALNGRVVQMTPRALARFQSFPDSYILPEKKSLACRIIGNAVPPLMMKKIVALFR